MIYILAELIYWTDVIQQHTGKEKRISQNAVTGDYLGTLHGVKNIVRTLLFGAVILCEWHLVLEVGLFILRKRNCRLLLLLKEW